MKIFISSLYVNDQEKALQFYTQKLGFVKKADIINGSYRWLTLVSAEDTGGTQLLLEPNENPIAQNFQQGLMDQGIAATIFEVDDLESEYNRLTGLGVKFLLTPQDIGPMKMAQLLDTCGNIIQLNQPGQ